jgi:hypothetical protein
MARALKENFGTERPILYAINANRGVRKSADDKNVKPSKDIFLFELGFDLIGENHVPRIWPRFADRKAKATIPYSDQGMWLFDRNDYGYHFTKKQDKSDREVKYNWPAFFEEAIALEQVAQKDGTVIDYVRSKKYADPNDVKKVLAVSKKWGYK